MSLVHQAAKEDCTVTELGRTGGDSIYYEMLRGLMADASIQVSPLSVCLHPMLLVCMT